MINLEENKQFNDPQTVRVLTGVIDVLQGQIDIIKQELSRNSSTGLDGDYLQDHEKWLHQCIIDSYQGFRRDLMTSAEIVTEAKRINPVIGGRFTPTSVGKILKKIGCYVQMRISYVDDNDERTQRRVWILRNVQGYAQSPIDVLADAYDSQQRSIMPPLLHKRVDTTPTSFM